MQNTCLTAVPDSILQTFPAIFARATPTPTLTAVGPWSTDAGRFADSLHLHMVINENSYWTSLLELELPLRGIPAAVKVVAFAAYLVPHTCILLANHNLGTCNWTYQLYEPVIHVRCLS